MSRRGWCLVLEGPPPRVSSFPQPPLRPRSTWQILHQTGGFGGARLILVGGAGRVAHEGSLLPGAAVVLIGHVAALTLEKNKEMASRRLLPTAESGHHASNAGRAPLGSVGRSARTCQAAEASGESALNSNSFSIAEKPRQLQGSEPTHCTHTHTRTVVLLTILL